MQIGMQKHRIFACVFFSQSNIFKKIINQSHNLITSSTLHVSSYNTDLNMAIVSMLMGALRHGCKRYCYYPLPHILIREP